MDNIPDRMLPQRACDKLQMTDVETVALHAFAGHC